MESKDRACTYTGSVSQDTLRETVGSRYSLFFPSVTARIRVDKAILTEVVARIAFFVITYIER